MKKKKAKATKSTHSPRKPRGVTDKTMPGRRITAKDAGYLSDRCFVLTMMDLDEPKPTPRSQRRKR
jgi:hypothetical protein